MMIPHSKIEPLILILRQQRVMPGRDLAKIYGVSTRRLNEQVKRNRKRFPSDFMFQLTRKEKEEVVANCDHLQPLKFSSSLPYAFTEYGALMAANVLNSTRAVSLSVYVIRAFVRIKETMATGNLSEKRFSVIEKMLLSHDQALREIIIKIRLLLMPKIENPKRRIGFHSLCINV